MRVRAHGRPTSMTLRTNMTPAEIEVEVSQAAHAQGGLSLSGSLTLHGTQEEIMAVPLGKMVEVYLVSWGEDPGAVKASPLTREAAEAFLKGTQEALDSMRGAREEGT